MGGRYPFHDAALCLARPSGPVIKGAPVANRLASSASPYLRQHAEDPVDWFPWGEEAFALARRLDRPVLLSCGYSACHWCHVMQGESFRDPATAALMNERYVAVKVDRELRPDVDAVYQDYVAATTGRGGWPLTVWMTPEGAPLIGGTHFPKDAVPGSTTFTDALTTIADAYGSDRAEVGRTAEASLDFLRKQAAERPEGPVDRHMVDFAADYLIKMQDVVHGGLRGSQKFPQLPMIEFLCAYGSLVHDVELSLAIERTMLAIVRGGIFDHVGGGVHRYATDAAWRTPHFEKMLYDQGLALSALAAAAPLASSPDVREEYAYAARRIADFLGSEMSTEDGRFIAALNADTGGVEGATYTWTRSQLAAALTPDELAVADAELGTDDAVGDDEVTLTRRARSGNAPKVDAVLHRLSIARAKRPQPDPDTKLLTAWNAMAARGLMEAGSEFDDAEMTASGVALVRRLLECAVTPTGVLREPDDPSIADVRLLEDAAHLVAATLTAADITSDEDLHSNAKAQHARTLEVFADGAALYMTPGAGDLPVRPREGGDSATPSGASTTIESAVRLGLADDDASGLVFARASLAQMWAVVDFAPEQAGRALASAVALEAAGLL